ncbi:hypothetical protein LSH36_353g06039 [Paralvinella palmiformis]|uniref:C2H2-type domain-containing protein n=1 Tax=Paralvinella palmiformis TaxID=53620 RepID=A0AAD9N012_9ANNE|nr:hypothetical protein LSH36_353g06039 [Paralvinella palmiformis]
MFEEMSRIQNMFQCLLDTCPEKFQDYQHRKDHMIKIHKYPANFRFDKPPKIKRRVKKERKQIKRHKGVEVMDTEDTSSQNEIILDDDKMPLSLSKLAFGCLSAKNPDPRLVSGQPTGVTGQPIGVTGQPTGVTGQPIGVTGQPIGVTGQPTGVTGQPIGVTGQPTGVTGHSGCELSTDADVCDSHDDANVDMETKCSTYRRFVYKKSNVPRNICFGAGSQRGFYGRGHSGKRGRHWYQAKKENKSTVRNIEEVNMEEIGAALET